MNKLKIAVIVEGGVVQSIICNQPSRLPNDVLVIDYDINGAYEDNLYLVPQDCGDDAYGLVYSLNPELPKINLDAVFAQYQLSRVNIKTFIPENDVIVEHGYMTANDIVELLRKYKSSPDAIQFIADMLEEIGLDAVFDQFQLTRMGS